MHSRRYYRTAVGHAGEKQAPIFPFKVAAVRRLPHLTAHSYCSQTACGAEPTDDSIAPATLSEVVIKAIDLSRLFHYEKHPIN